MATNIQFTPFAPGTTDQELARISSLDPRLTRTNYFDGRLLKASDLTRDQVYLDERLLEAGQVLGSGIAAGLDLSLVDNHKLRLTPGLAVAPSGRILNNSRTLEIDLQDSALIATLNDGSFRRWRRGLYCVVVQYGESCDGAAEAYPQDLAAPRSIRCNGFAEGVELGLVPLRIRLPQSEDPSGLGARAALVRDLIGGSAALADLPDEAVALGLLALDSASPLWLDLGLVRRPLRPPLSTDALQQDLATHYEELLNLVLAARGGSGLTGGFAASQYFRVLPPFGHVPKAAVDPEHGTQSFFPDGYEVSIAPVRRADLPAILREAAPLAPMDLERDRDADVMVLVPMSDQAFAWRARQLEQGANAPQDAFGLGRLLAIDSLSLRLFPAPQAHALDLDADTWRAIWAETADDEVHFVRRPARTAETNVSALVLARGFALPPLTEGIPTDPAQLEARLDTALEDLAAAQDKVTALNARIAELEATTVDDRVTALQAQVANLQAQLAAATQGGDTSAQALADAQAQISQLTALVAATEAQRDSAQAATVTAQAATAAAIAAQKAAQTERDAAAAARDALAADLKACELKLEQAGGTAPAGPDILAIAKLRQLTGTPLKAAQKLADVLSGQAEPAAAVVDIAILVERRYDPVLWTSLLTVANQPERLPKLRDTLADKLGPDISAARLFVEIGPDFGLTAEQITQWKELAG